MEFGNLEENGSVVICNILYISDAGFNVLTHPLLPQADDSNVVPYYIQIEELENQQIRELLTSTSGKKSIVKDKIMPRGSTTFISQVR